jgi:hypothetical protein
VYFYRCGYITVEEFSSSKLYVLFTNIVEIYKNLRVKESLEDYPVIFAISFVVQSAYFKEIFADFSTNRNFKHFFTSNPGTSGGGVGGVGVTQLLGSDNETWSTETSTADRER